MDDSAAGRLQKLQMADLGTARREYISTREAKRHAARRIEDIEGSRMSNTAGSEAQRLAQSNKEQLSKWSNMYKEIGDAEDLEQLDELMHGQSHRANLTAKVQESGGQNYSKRVKKDDNFLRLSRTTALRSMQSSGRGGGVAGTRGRGSYPAQPSRVSHQGAVVKSGHLPSQEQRPTKYRPLDPALNPAEGPPKSRDQSQSYGGKGRGYSKAREQSQRPRRAPSAANYVQALMSPDSFLAQARNLLNTRAPSGDQSPIVKPPGTPKQGTDATKQSPSVSKAASIPRSVTGPASGAKRGASSPGGSSPNVSKVAPSPKPVPGPASGMKSGALVSGGSSPAPTSSPAVKGLHSPKHASPISKPVSAPATTKGPPVKESPGSGSQPSPAQTSTPQKKNEKPQAGYEDAEDVLIDISTTPSTDEMLSSSMNRMSLMSPGIKDLSEIDFQRDAMETPTQQRTVRPPPGLVHTGQPNFDDAMVKYMERPPGLIHRQKISNFEDAMAEYEMEKVSDDMELETPPDEPSNPEIDSCRRQISELRDIIKTKELSSGTLRFMEASIQDLETKLNEALKGSSETPQASGGSRRQEDANKPSTPQATASNTSMPANNEAGVALETAIKRVESKANSGPKDSPGSSTISPSRLKAAVAAPPFVPARKPSFTQYRSPHDSVSSDSTIFQQQPSNTSDHIFGDHLLPGRRNRQSSVSNLVASKQPYHPDEPKQPYHAPPQSSTVSFATPFNTIGSNHSIFCPTYPETPKEQIPTLVAPGTTPDTLKTPTRASTLGPPPSLSAVASGPNKPLGALQQSIHAPSKPQSPSARPSSIHASAGSGSASSDLQKSRYAPENHKPYR